MAELLLETASSSSRPAVILDITGVFHTYADTCPESYEIVPEMPWFAYNPAHGPWLRKVLEMADVHYISDWRASSHDVIGRHLDLPELDWINTDPYRQAGTGATRALTLTALFEHRPLVWLDDDIGRDQMKWSEERAESGRPTLLIATNLDRGLQNEQMLLVDEWLSPYRDQ